MNENTMQLTIIPDPETEENTAESAVETTGSTRWFARTPKKHRIQDRLRELKEKLKRTEKLNEELGETLRDALERNVDLQEQIAELEERLRMAEAANRANALSVDFHFAERQVDGPADEATMPVPQAVLIADAELDAAEQRIIAATAEAATAFLDRVVPSTRPRVEKPPMALAPPRETAATTVMPAITPVRPAKVATSEVNDENQVWNARSTERGFPVTWGRQAAETLRTDQSTTGTFRVVPLHSRGNGPDSIPEIIV